MYHFLLKLDKVNLLFVLSTADSGSDKQKLIPRITMTWKSRVCANEVENATVYIGVLYRVQENGKITRVYINTQGCLNVNQHTTKYKI